MSETDWAAYLATYHAGHPGITETALNHARHPVHGSAYQWLAEVAPDPAGDVVDLACGSSPLQPLVNHRSYVGVDQSAAELSAARTAGRGPVVLGDITDLDLPDASADTVIMSMALMLVPLAPVLDQVARLLRPGGIFVTMAPTTWPVKAHDLPAVAVLSAALRGPGSMPRRLGSAALQRQLGKAGLRITSLTRERFPFPLSTARDARLAVQSLYTPGRTADQLRRAESWLTRLPGRTELPVPLLRLAARRDATP